MTEFLRHACTQLKIVSRQIKQTSENVKILKHPIIRCFL